MFQVNTVLLTCTLAAMAVLIPGPPPTSAAPAGKDTLDGRLRELQKERVKALKEQLEGQFERVKIGKDPLIIFIEAVRELCEAELELADTHGAKVAARERMVKSLRECEESMSQLQQAGLQTKEGVAQVKAARLKAEIEFEKLKGGK